MSNAATRSHSGDRFYNPPAIRRHHQMLLQQQQQQQQQQIVHKQLQRPSQSENRVDPSEREARTDSDESTLSKPNSARSVSPPKKSNSTNLDRLMESVTPFVPAQLPEARVRGWRTREADPQPFFCLGDLWESFKEWSVYGVGVPLILNGSESIIQYYVPSLSGIQLYVNTLRLSDGESSRETTSAGSSDCDAEKRAKGEIKGSWGQHDVVSLNSQRLQRMALRDKPQSLLSDESEIRNSPGQLVFEYFEKEQPYHRKPLYDKVSNLALEFPEINLYKSCDLLPSSWVSVAWYPIYRIPMGPTLQNLDASFLTFHSLSTSTKSKHQEQLDASSGRKACGVGPLKVALPAFGLASYKLRGSILTQSGGHEWQQASSLLQAADNWLHYLGVNLPDFQFFISHNSQRR